MGNSIDGVASETGHLALIHGIILICRQREEILVVLLEKAAACPTCQHCGAEIKIDMDKECPGCHRDIKECVIDKDVTSSVYPM